MEKTAQEGTSQFIATLSEILMGGQINGEHRRGMDPTGEVRKALKIKSENLKGDLVVEGWIILQSKLNGV